MDAEMPILAIGAGVAEYICKGGFTADLADGSGVLTS